MTGSKPRRLNNPPRAAKTAKASRPEVSPVEIQGSAAAAEVGLSYMRDDEPGITRRATRGGKFQFLSPQGKVITDEATIARIKHLAIPPAWTDVWISPKANGHIQATGRDVRGRKQYRYHADWRESRDSTKFNRMLAFGKALPRIRRRVARDLRRPGLGREKILATMVRLLETTLIRVGNEEYAKQNHSFGLSTMRDRHVEIERGVLHFSFRGKSGKQHHVDLHDPRLAKIVRQSQELPGQELFQYVDEAGNQQKVSSHDVNEYLRSIAGQGFSAKDFRTWAGTVLAAVALKEFQRFDSHAEAKRNLVSAIENVARRLGNTPAICRKCYVHPVVMESYLDGETVELLQAKTEEVLRHDFAGLRPEEGAVLAFLQGRLRKTLKQRKAA